MLNLSSLVRIAKRYAYNPSIANERLINSLLEPYVLAANVRGRGGADFYLDKHRTSRILNGEADVPLALRGVALQHGLEGRVAKECGVLFDETLDPSLFEYLRTDVLSLFDDSDPRQDGLRKHLYELDRPESFFAAALIGVVTARNVRDDEGCFWKKGPGSLCWRSGDLLRFGFGNRKKSRNLVVVPVDCGFRTHVTRQYEGVLTQEVSERSVHGQWLTRMAQSGVLEEDLKGRISAALVPAGITSEERAGLCPRGTVVAIDTKSATYLLLAVSEFDERGVAGATRGEVEESLLALIRYYDENGQGADLYLPLVGTGLSRSEMSKGESLEMIRRVVTEQSPFIGGKVTIVVRPEDAEEIGLLRKDWR